MEIQKCQRARHVQLVASTENTRIRRDSQSCQQVMPGDLSALFPMFRIPMLSWHVRLSVLCPLKLWNSVDAEEMEEGTAFLPHCCKSKARLWKHEANAEMWSLHAALLSHRSTKPTTHFICTMPVLPSAYKEIWQEASSGITKGLGPNGRISRDSNPCKSNWSIQSRHD